MLYYCNLDMIISDDYCAKSENSVPLANMLIISFIMN